MPERQPRRIRLKDSVKPEALEGTYLIDGYCFNCEWSGEIDIPKGTPMAFGNKLGDLSRCPDCACHTLQRWTAMELEELKALDDVDDAIGEAGGELPRERQDEVRGWPNPFQPFRGYTPYGYSNEPRLRDQVPPSAPADSISATEYANAAMEFIAASAADPTDGMTTVDAVSAVNDAIARQAASDAAHDASAAAIRQHQHDSWRSR